MHSGPPRLRSIRESSSKWLDVGIATYRYSRGGAVEEIRFVARRSTSILPGKLCIGAPLDPHKRPRVSAIFGMVRLQEILAHKGQAEMFVKPPAKNCIPSGVGSNLLAR